MYAPIAVFVYNRPLHTERCLLALAANPLAAQSHVYVFSDGPKSPCDTGAVERVRDVVRATAGFASVTLLASEQNRGLANSIIRGVTEIVEANERVIVLEDDLVVAPTFLQFMNAGLDAFCDEPRIAQISGFQFPVRLSPAEGCLFLPITTSWGWGTWRRSWNLLDQQASGYDQVRKSRTLRRRFNLQGAYDYFGMLEAQLAGQIDSWAIRWQLSVFLAGGLTLYPDATLVSNTGFDGSGTHCTPGTQHSSGEPAGRSAFRGRFPGRIEVSDEWGKVRAYLRRNRSVRSRWMLSLKSSPIPFVSEMALWWGRGRRRTRDDG